MPFFANHFSGPDRVVWLGICMCVCVCLDSTFTGILNDL